MNIQVTILIVTCNTRRYLELTIDSIRKNTHIPYKMIVIDNGSDLNTLNYLAGQKDILILRNSKNLGYIHAQYQGFQLVETPYLCSCNDDILVTKGWLEVLLQKIKKSRSIKIVSPVKYGSKFLHPYTPRSSREVWDSLKLDSTNKDPLDLIRMFTFGKSLDDFAKDFKTFNKHGDKLISLPDFIPGFCFLTETKIWGKIGGFVDKDMDTYGTEDIERCWRLSISGYRVMRTDAVYVHHFEGASVGQNSIYTNKYLAKNNRLLLRKMGYAFWKWLNGQLKKKSLQKIIEEHWIVLQLLRNIERSEMPKDIMSEWEFYEKDYK